MTHEHVRIAVTDATRPGVERVPTSNRCAWALQRIEQYITYYGEALTDLPDDTWSTSQAQWMDDLGGERALPTYQLALVVAHTAVQPNSAVMQYRKLWGSLEARPPVRLPRGRRTEEIVSAEEGGLRWRGAIMVDDDDALNAMTVLESEPISILVAVPATSMDQVDAVVASGWTRAEQGPPTEIVQWACSNSGIAFWPVGAFDDPESGVVAFGPPHLIAELEESAG